MINNVVYVNVMTLNCKKYNFALELILLSYLFKKKKKKKKPRASQSDAVS